MKSFNKKHKPKHFAKAKWCFNNLYTISLKEKNRKYVKTVKGYCLIKKNLNKNKDKTFKQNPFKLSNLAIGKKFRFKNKKYKVVNSNNCNDCGFKEQKCFELQCHCLIPECSDVLRKDKTGVKFVETRKH